MNASFLRRLSSRSDAPLGRPRAWPVLGVTVALVPLSIWLVAMLSTIVALGAAFLRIAVGEIPLGALGIEAQRVLDTLFERGVWPLVIGVTANGLAFASVALCATFGRTEAQAGAMAWARLRLDRWSGRDVAIAVMGLLGLTSALDAALDLLSLSDVGRLAELRETLMAVGGTDRALLALLLGLGAGVAEELYFRGYMLTKLELARGRALALVVSSLAFGLFHWDAVHSPVAALMGLYLGACVLISGSLWTGLVAHVINNMIATVSVNVSLPKGSAPLALGLALAALSLVALRRKHPGEPRPAVW